MISDSEILFWMSLGSVSISRQSKAIKLCGSVSEVWNQFISNDKLKQLFDDKYDILKRYRSEQFIHIKHQKFLFQSIRYKYICISIIN